MPGIREYDAPGAPPGGIPGGPLGDTRGDTRGGTRASGPGSVPGGDPVNEVIRWSAFGCAVVPAVLLLCGSPLSGAMGAAVGLAAVTAASRCLLRYYERAAARLGSGVVSPHRGRHSRTGIGTHRGGRRT
ncbi:hypothetical protein [Streptomyces botrytidirepellens]|uniref:hypothetical protein n=1 Tax=Streptomyces botrytidirepellens TaxID=2486417 RepID=UPI001FE4AD7F|nr:hypothetical protein [Streptomyces botrytidirepellens]